ncbi:hypothetical protein BV96_00999 [Sphingomonas paucimobilis]|nr:hypothetical protein BV96_00999 [Sphingomonas paucimobilis]
MVEGKWADVADFPSTAFGGSPPHLALGRISVLLSDRHLPYHIFNLSGLRRYPLSIRAAKSPRMKERLSAPNRIDSRCHSSEKNIK